MATVDVNKFGLAELANRTHNNATIDLANELTEKIYPKIEAIDGEQNREANEINDGALEWGSPEFGRAVQRMLDKNEKSKKSVYDTIEDESDRELMKRLYDRPFFSVKEMELW